MYGKYKRTSTEEEVDWGGGSSTIQHPTHGTPEEAMLCSPQVVESYTYI